MKALAVAVIVGATLAVASPAGANPWDGGLDVQSPGEAAFSTIASEIAGKPATVRCWSPDEWNGNPWGGADARGYVFPGSAVAEISPATCGALEAFRVATLKPGCAGAPVRQRYTLRVRQWRWVKRNGKRVRARVWVRVGRTRTVPGGRVFCPFAEAKTISLAAQTLAHESIHLQGVRDEAVAECYGRQLARTVLTRLGAPNRAYASALASYATVLYPPDSPYYSAECRDGGALDLAPANPVWP